MTKMSKAEQSKYLREKKPAYYVVCLSKGRDNEQAA